jgi:hypothetical protein
MGVGFRPVPIDALLERRLMPVSDSAWTDLRMVTFILAQCLIV